MTDLFNRTVDKLRESPVGPVVKILETYPRLSAWVVLSAGMLILLVIAAKDVGVLPGQWVGFVIATILVAGACIWIISWEENEDDAAEDTSSEVKAEPESEDQDDEK